MTCPVCRWLADHVGTLTGKAPANMTMAVSEMLLAAYEVASSDTVVAAQLRDPELPAHIARVMHHAVAATAAAHAAGYRQEEHAWLQRLGTMLSVHVQLPAACSGCPRGMPVRSALLRPWLPWTAYLTCCTLAHSSALAAAVERVA